MAKDIKIGIIGIAVIMALIWTVKTVRKLNLLDPDKTIIALFQGTGGIQPDNNVVMNGLKVGKVIRTEAADADLSSVKISLKVNKYLNIPVNSVARIEQNLLGSPMIVIEKGNATEYLQNNGRLQTKEEPGTLENFQVQAKPLARKVNRALDSFSISLNKYNAKLSTQKRVALQKQLSNLRIKMARYAIATNQMGTQYNTYLKKLQALTQKSAAGNDSINLQLSGIHKKLANLQSLKLADKTDSIRRVLVGLDTKLSSLNSGKLASLTSNKTVVDSLLGELTKIQALLDDVRVYPKKYFYISVLGNGKTTSQTLNRQPKQK